jgi:hypothetical protein
MVIKPYDLHLYLLFKDIDQLRAEGHDLYTAYHLAKQRSGFYERDGTVYNPDDTISDPAQGQG